MRVLGSLCVDVIVCLLNCVLCSCGNPECTVKVRIYIVHLSVWHCEAPSAWPSPGPRPSIRSWRTSAYCVVKRTFMKRTFMSWDRGRVPSRSALLGIISDCNGLVAVSVEVSALPGFCQEFQSSQRSSHALFASRTDFGGRDRGIAAVTTRRQP